MAVTDTATRAVTEQTRARHKWFPLLVIAAAAAWWIWESTVSHYQTLAHVLVVLFGAALLTGYLASERLLGA